MSVNWDIRAVLLTIAAFQAIIVSILLLRRSLAKHNQSDLLLALFLLAMTAVLFEHIAGWLNLYVGQRLTYFPFGSTFLFAPLACLYVYSVTNNQYKPGKSAVWHFIPACIYFSVHLYIWFHPLPQKQALIDTLFRYKWQQIEGYAGAIVFTVYLYKIITHYKTYLKWLTDEYSNTEKLKLGWVRNFMVLLIIYYMVYLGFGVASLINWYGYKTQFWLYLMLAVVIYYISAAGYAYVNKLTVAFNIHPTNTKHHVSSEPSIGNKEDKEAANEIPCLQPGLSNNSASLPQTIPNEVTLTSALKIDTDSLRHSLLRHLASQKPYLDSDLTLSQLSNQLEKPAYIITQVIKNSLATNFNDLINSYRVNAVIEKLKQGEHKNQTLLAIAYDCGFNSKATFNRAFKKAKNISPSQFVKKLS